MHSVRSPWCNVIGSLPTASGTYLRALPLTALPSTTPIIRYQVHNYMYTYSSVVKPQVL